LQKLERQTSAASLYRQAGRVFAIARLIAQNKVEPTRRGGQHDGHIIVRIPDVQRRERVIARGREDDVTSLSDTVEFELTIHSGVSLGPWLPCQATVQQNNRTPYRPSNGIDDFPVQSRSRLEQYVQIPIVTVRHDARHRLRLVPLCGCHDCHPTSANSFQRERAIRFRTRRYRFVARTVLANHFNRCTHDWGIGPFVGDETAKFPVAQRKIQRHNALVIRNVYETKSS
jgi:hypothetical protein